MKYSKMGFKSLIIVRIFDFSLYYFFYSSNNFLVKFHLEREIINKNEYGYEEFKSNSNRDTYLGTEIADIHI